MADIKEGGVLYMYQYLYHTSLDHMHLQIPTKKERFLSNPTQTCMLLYSRYHGKEWSCQHATLTYFCMKLLLPLFRLSCFLF